MDRKLNYSKEKLRPIILEIAGLNGYENPITYLNELLDQVKSFNDPHFLVDFYLNVHYLCNEYSNKFWNNHHKEQITGWLKKAPIISGTGNDPHIFDTTWESEFKIQFADFLTNIENKQKFAQLLIDEFKNENSSGLAFMIYVLEQKNNIKGTQNKLYEAMKKDFGFKFTENAIFDCKRKIEPNKTHEAKIQQFNGRIEFLLNTI